MDGIREIETSTLRKATHVAVSENTAFNLVNQYSELVNSDAELIYSVGEKKCNILDVSDYLGATVLITLDDKDDFKILEEVTSYS
jgi:hypothetical protein